MYCKAKRPKFVRLDIYISIHAFMHLTSLTTQDIYVHIYYITMNIIEIWIMEWTYHKIHVILDILHNTVHVILHILHVVTRE